MTEIGDWGRLARRIRTVNDANGWARPTMERLLGKLMLVVTELDETIQAVGADCDEGVDVEIADAAIRILHCLDTLWPGAWHLREAPEVGRYAPIEAICWRVITPLCDAAEAWRDDHENDIQCSLERAFAACRGIAEALEFDLYRVATDKVEINATRGPLHGRANPAG